MNQAHFTPLARNHKVPKLATEAEFIDFLIKHKKMH